MKKLTIYLPRILPWLAVLLGVFLTVLAFFPGYMSLDSFEQLTQARTGVYYSAHPPLMAWIWSFLDKMIPGPLGMLIFFAMMFWVGLAFFVNARIANPFLAAAIILVVGLFPSVFALLGTVWKDVGMGAALVLGVGLISRASQSQNLYVLGCSLPFLFLAYSVRHEAGFAVFPILVWVAAVWKRSVLFSLLAALLCLTAFWGLKTAIHHFLIETKSATAPIQNTWVFDLVGMSLPSDTIFLPPYLMDQDPEFNFEEVRRIYDPSNSLPLFKDGERRKRFPAAKTREEYESLFAYWQKAVRENPWQYLEHRWRFFQGSLSIHQPIVCFPYQVGISSNALGITHLKSRLNQFVWFHLTRIRDTWVFRAWVYLALSMVLFWIGVWLRSLEICALSASALLYAAIHFFILSTCDFRYHWWTVLSDFLCLIVLVSGIFRTRSVPPSPKRSGATVVEVPGSHAIYVSKPSGVVELIEKAAKGA